jgi:hypothetical protein
MSPITAEGGVVELTREEGRAMLGGRTQRELGMTLEQFEAAYDACKLDMSRSEVIGLVMLLPFARLQISYFGERLLAEFPRRAWARITTPEYPLQSRQQFHLMPEGPAWRVTTDAYQYGHLYRVCCHRPGPRMSQGIS